MKKETYRHEIKYLVSISEYLAIRNRLKGVMYVDKNGDEKGRYHVRSLYFDNYENKALYEKITGNNYREKFRIRYYNFDTTCIRLEKKSKENGYTLKKTCGMTKSECTAIIKNGYVYKETENKVLKEFYEKLQRECLKPVTLVDYVREAYTYPSGNVRVTFDRHIKTGLFNIDVFNKNATMIEACHRESPIVMEVKFDAFLPDLIRHLLQTNHQKSIAVSKYVLCRNYY